MNIPSNILTLIAGIAITLISLWYGQNHGLLPVAASAEATQVDDIFNMMMTIATGLFLLIEGILIISVIKFRRREGDQTDGPAWEGNIPLEIVWTAIPTVIVFILAIYSFEIYNNMGGLDPMNSRDPGPQVLASSESTQRLIALDPSQADLALGIGASPGSEQQEEGPLVVNVQGIQYAWIFTYQDSGVVSGELHIPIGRPVELNISAGDVLHAFWLPEFRIKQDAIPGRETKLIFTATRTGEYPIICAELCGAYHGAMKSQLFVQAESEYNQWVQDNTFAQADLDEAVAANADSVLASHAQEAGIQPETLAQLQAHHHAAIDD
ncbi:MAG: cytochrome c oxidase subunit II [Cyanophyceae cyanobacterium]